MKLRHLFIFLCVGAVFLGVFFRFYNLKESGLFFYDEGFYLHHNLPALELIEANPPQGLADVLGALRFYLTMALSSGKSLWFMMMDARFFFGALHDWTFPKVLAAFFGLLLLPISWWFARQYYEDRDTALFSVALMSILPGLVFYSRIGLQEALSTCLVLGGLSLYVFPRRFSWQALVGGLLLAAAFFANYRLIVLPFVLLCVELWEGVVLRKGFNFRKWLWTVLVFVAAVVLIGNLMNGANTRVIFAWVFHQEDLVEGSFSWINFLSHPFYLFLMETVLFATAFFAAAFFFLGRLRQQALPFILVLVQMVIFSITSEKGARYLCVMLPFAVMSVACVILHVYKVHAKAVRWSALGFTGAMALLMMFKSWDLVRASSDYEKAIQLIEQHDAQALILSTQDQVQSLYVRPYTRVQAVPARFDRLAKLYDQGYRYMVIDPQAYVGLTGGFRFLPDLRDYLALVDKNLTPVAVLPHMNHAMLERFVCEHSENLPQSIRFLFDPDADRMASIRIYDLNGVVPQMNKIYLHLLKNR